MSGTLFDDDYESGLRNRRRILGDPWVDRSLDKANTFNADFQNLITRFAWHEIWGRPGLEPRARRMLVLAITMALGRWEEFELHVRAALADQTPNGLTVAELKEVLMQGAIYAGVPASNTAFSLAQEILHERGIDLAPAVPADAAHPGVGRHGFTRATPSLHYTIREPQCANAVRRTFVLSHALGCDLGMWDALANQLARDARVVCYDHRGHGRSEAPPGPYGIAELAEDAAALLEELGAGPVIWIGVSMGGMVGQELALRHPQLVDALVVANSTSGYPAATKAMWQERIATVLTEGIDAIADAVMARYFHPGFHAAQPATVARFRRRLVATRPTGYLGCCQAVADVDTTSRLASIKAPTLVVAGALDTGTPAAMSEAIAAGIPGARLVVLPDASHLSPIEQPALFLDAVKDFLETI